MHGYKVVGVDTVISNLYRLYKESLVITIDDTMYKSSDYKTSEEAYSKISEACDKLSKTGSEYIESYQEIKVSGIYKYADDGSELTITPGATKTYITYTSKTT